jgi:hypothetical protein
MAVALKMVVTAMVTVTVTVTAKVKTAEQMGKMKVEDATGSD